nr:thioesterase family protein [Janibacter cremeus]
MAPQEWEDENGHVNVAAYYRFHMESVALALEGLGWTEGHRQTTGQSVFSVEQHLRFYDEALVGHDVSIHLRLLNRNEKMFHAVSMLLNRSTGRLANTLEFVEANVDLRSRRMVPFSYEFGSKLDGVIVRHNELPWAVPLNTGMGLR